MKKRNKLLSVLLATALLMSACGNSSSGSSTGSSDSGSASSASESTETEGGSEQASAEADFSKPTTVTLYGGGNDATGEAMNALIEKFNAENEYNITVEISSPSDYETLMKTMMASNNLPDIFSTHGWAVRRYDEYLYDLSNEPWAEYVDDTIRDIITDDNGKLCTMPIAQAIEGIQFNKNILDEYGIVPQELDTWDKFIDALKKIRDESNGEVIPFYLPGSDAGIIGFLANTLFAVNIGGNESANADALLEGDGFDWTNMANVMVKIKAMADENLFNDGWATAQVPDLIEAIASEKCAFTFMGTQVLESATDVNPDLVWGFMPIPAMTDLGTTEPAFTNGEEGTYGIWKDSPNLEAARKVLEWLAQPENVAFFCETASKPAGMTNANVDMGSVNEYYDIYSGTKGVGQFDRTYLPNGCYDVFSDAQAKVLMGALSAEEGVEMVKEEYERLFGNDD